MSKPPVVRQTKLNMPNRVCRALSAALLMGFLLSLAGWQGQRAAATAKLPSSTRDAAATFTVTNTTDSLGAGTLRQAIKDANDNGPGLDDIIFGIPPFNTPQTITLTGGELEINSSLTINGPGANLLTVSGNNASRVFNIGSGFTVSLSGMTITGGNASAGGGVVNVGTLTVTNSTISGNTANGVGGGIFNNGTLTVTNSTVSGNTAALGGGGIFNNGGRTLTVTNSTISGNTANGGGGGGRGGGIENFGNLTVTNSTISGNRVPNGDNNGGGILTFVTATITNSTITNNSAAGANSAGGVVRNSGTVTVRSSIIAGNVNNANQPDVVSSANPGGFTITSSGFNLIGNRGAIAFSQPGDQSGGAGNPILNPFLGPLQNNGGATPTYALLGGSSALNAGNASGLTTDQRGVPRVSGASADIGAVEMQALIVTNTTDSLGAGTLRQAITTANDNGPGLDDIIFGIPPFNTTQTINLLTALPDITSSVTINGPGANLLTVRRADNAPDFRIFTITGGPVTISGMKIGNGRASGGGGIFSQSPLTLTNVHVTGNQASAGGGGVDLQFADGVFTGCTFSANTAAGGGGILYEDDEAHTLRLLNCTVSGNQITSGGGGGIRHFCHGGESRLEIVSSTIAGNTAGSGSGGIAMRTDEGEATMTLRNTIIASNTPANLATERLLGLARITSLGFNLTSDNSLQTLEFLNQPTDFVNTNPLLGPLQDNGGPTPTHALRFGSRALDAGHSSGTMTDQRGLPRRVDLATINNERDSDGADIGAYEAQSAPVQVTPTLAINDVSKAEGNSGTTAFDFTVTLSESSAHTVTVDFLSGGGTATAGSDYTPVEGRLTFTPGQTTRTITVQVNGDTTVEPDETFFVNLRSPTNATIADAQGMGTIVNDDQLVSLIVQNTNDSGADSLRQVIANAPAGSVITFAPTVFNVVRTITLSDQLLINKNLTINGPGANLLTISGNDAKRVLRIQSRDLNVALSDLTISNGKGVGNGNDVNDGYGGGILSDSALTLTRCAIVNCSATFGGGVYLQGAAATLTECTISGNTANFGGGLNFDSTGINQRLVIANSTISGNRGTSAGGALVHLAQSGNSMTQIVNSTIANNISADGGGIYISAANAGTVTAATTRNSIYANNTNTNLRTNLVNGGTATISSLGYNLTTGAGSGLLTATGDQINANPLLGPLANNGGATQTHALLAGSPAQDKGQRSGSTTDQRVNPRPFDDPALENATGGDGADIGAFEQGQQLFPVSSANYTTPLAQESIAAAFGVNLSNGVGVASAIPLPTTLNEASFIVRDSVGMERLAPLFFAAPGQVNFQIPPGTMLGPATIIARRNGVATAGATIEINAVEPGLFTANASGSGLPAGLALRVKADNSLSYEPVATYNAATQRFEPVPINLGPASDRVFLILYGTGIRNAANSLGNVSINVGGTVLPVLFAGLVGGFVGLDQINSEALPRTLIGRKEITATVFIGAKSTNTVMLVIQ